MKKYIKTITLKAEPMLYSEFNAHMGWEDDDNKDPNEEGFLMIFPDGYETWNSSSSFVTEYEECGNLSTLPETSNMMCSADYIDQFQAEYFQLAIRYEKLKSMLERYDKGELDFPLTCPRSTYDMQAAAMADYLAILEARAVMENIDLDEVALVDDTIPEEKAVVDVKKEIKMNNQIENNFTYHVSENEQQNKNYELIGNKAKVLAYLIDDVCPDGREKSLAMTKLEESVMWADASISRSEN